MRFQGGKAYYGNFLGIMMVDMTAPLIPGDVGNALSYDFPVRYKVLKNIPPDWYFDETGADDSRCQILIEAAQELEAEGCRAITAGCGMFSVYQDRVAAAVDIPVFLSPMLMVPLLLRMLNVRKKVGIMTGGAEQLKDERFLKTVGITEPERLVFSENLPRGEAYEVYGLGTKTSLDCDVFKEEVVTTAVQLYRESPDLGCFLLECSSFPPFARAIAQETGLPVFDTISLAHLIGRGICPVQYPEFWG